MSENFDVICSMVCLLDGWGLIGCIICIVCMANRVHVFNRPVSF